MSPPTTTTAANSRRIISSPNFEKRLFVSRGLHGPAANHPLPLRGGDRKRPNSVKKRFEDRVKKICPEAVWLSTDKYAGATRDSAMREAGPLVLQFKDQVDGIFAPNESSAVGTKVVLESQGLNKKILVMGFDASQPLLDAIGNGDIVGSILQDPYRMGYKSTYYCVQYLRGVDINDHRRDMSESTGEYLITKENLDTEFTLGLYDKEAQKRRDTRPWRNKPLAGEKP